MFAERYRAEMRYPGYMGVGLEVSVKVYPLEEEQVYICGLF